MELATQRAPSLWNSLLWKDFQQIKSTWFAISVVVFAIQLLLLTLTMIASEIFDQAGAMQVTTTLACIAPVLIAIGCSGMLIGQERQSGTWAWSTSLPVTWRQALGSKLLVTFTSTLTAGLALGVIPLLLFLNNRIEVANGPLVGICYSGVTFLILCEVIVFFFLATLLIREPLAALVVAGIALTIGQVLIGSLIGAVSHDYFQKIGLDAETAGILTATLLFGSVLLTGMVAMVAAFRWRWGLGQHFALSLHATASVPAAAWGTRYRYVNEKSPSLLRMLTYHSFTNSFWLRASVVIGTTLLCISGAVSTEVIVILAPVIGGILGLSAFEGDQSLQRIRFLADRGVGPKTLVINRLLVALLWMIICFAILGLSVFWLQSTQTGIVNAFVIGLVIFTLGAFTTMCFRRPIIAATLTCGVVMVGSVLWQAMFASFLYSPASSYQFSADVLLVAFSLSSPLIFVILIIGMFRLAREWIIDSGSKLERQYVKVTALAILLPVLVTSTFLYQLIPSTPWQGLSNAELTQPLPTVPNLDRKPLPLFTGRVSIPVEESQTNELIDELAQELKLLQKADAEPSETSQEPTAKIDRELAQVIEPQVTQFEQVLRGARSVAADRAAYVSALNNAIVRTVMLAEICTRIDDLATAARLWKINRELQELAQTVDPIESAPARNFALRSLAKVTSQQLEAMGGSEFLSAVTPQAADERAALVFQERRRATLELEGLRGNTPDSEYPWHVRIYPPLRWFAERRLAQELRFQLNRDQNQRPNYLTGYAHDELMFWNERSQNRALNGDANAEPIPGPGLEGLGESSPALLPVESTPTPEEKN